MDPSAYEAESRFEETHWWFVIRRRLLGSIIQSIGLARSADILDIGTSTGSNLRMLRQLGFQGFTGLDLHDAAIAWCARRGLGEVRKGDICSMPFPDQSFDLVLATDIIEHVENDSDALSEILRVLRPDGKVIITVPAFRMLWGLQDRVAHHKRRYRLGELLRKLRSAGFAPEEAFYFNFLLFAPIFVARKVIDAFNVKLASEGDLNHPILNAILMRIFLLDVWLARRIFVPFGVSALIVARRKKA